jgi:hypothetical protein
MSKHTTSPGFDTSGAAVVRRKGRKVRFQDRTTARMSPWMTDPNARLESAKAALRKRVADQNAERKANRAKAVEVESYGRMRKAELQSLAKARGIPFNTKTTNAALIAALSA